ncbi:hypothetical protein JCM16303_003631 [Sporobolomyces ruberrimus]
MSLNSLPPELLRDVIEAAIPRSYHSTTYSGRQQTLCSLCLVSRRFHQIASPLLSEIVRIESEKSFQLVLLSLSAKDGIDADIKALKLIFSNAHQQCLNTSALGMLSDRCPALSALTIIVDGASDLSFDRPSPFPDLSDLHLHGLSFHLATPFFGLRSLTLSGFRAINLSDLHLYGFDFRPTSPLHSLRSLALIGFRATNTFCFNTQPMALPSLRYLALSSTDNAFYGRLLPDESMLAQVLPQLDAWSIDLPGLSRLYHYGGPAILAAFASRALVDCSLTTTSSGSYFYSGSPEAEALTKVQHIRLLHTSTHPTNGSDISSFKTFLRSLPSFRNLRSIYLNSFTQADSVAGGGIAEEVEKLTRLTPARFDIFPLLPYLLSLRGPLLDMSLNSLPPELLRDIVEAAIPYSYHSATYKDRRQTLYNLCLVSRRFRQFAQPLLFDVVAIKSGNGLERLLQSLASKGHAGTGIKSLALESCACAKQWLHVESLERILAISPALSSLTIYHLVGQDCMLDPISRFQSQYPFTISTGTLSFYPP